MVDVIIDFLFLVDVALNFRTAYISKGEGKYLLHPYTASVLSEVHFYKYLFLQLTMNRMSSCSTRGKGTIKCGQAIR